MERDEEQLQELQRAMYEAAARGDFEKAAQLRDRISLLRGMPLGEPAQDFDPSGLVRQQPGTMGLGTSRQHVKPPSGWQPPKKPDPMTKGRGRGRRSNP
ncbi:excinuclease ABC subunit B [Novosphingobium barchaimii LL02]|uniref:Excinuclease ABC subunit B n=1 Tax=Novosphingobium barchaimii LL02 TaxID=1114963 RepID=A0A0J7XJ52_9SPHN|nr:UvrB/UvrC motif-containing protein [Novosphingobium barchaimii]KMS51684.1 excinuclease ABC subunit B [Novosphingobium barchaimii LL02]